MVRREVYGSGMTLTECQQRLVWVLDAWRAIHGTGPTLAELGAALHVGISTVRQHVLALERKGVVARRAGEPRSLALVGAGHYHRWHVEIGDGGGEYETRGSGLLEAAQGAIDLWWLAGCPGGPLRAMTVRRME